MQSKGGAASGWLSSPSWRPPQAFAVFVLALVLFALNRRLHTVGPPAASIGQQPAIVPTLLPRSAFRRVGDKRPAGAEQEFFEVRLELFEPRELGEEIAA